MGYMIIGLSGYARSGKNTVADILGEQYRQVSFAEPMREILLIQNPIIGLDTGMEVTVVEAVGRLGWDGAKSTYPEVRRHLQVLGTEVGREMFGQDFWVHMAIKGIKPTDNVVFTDVRFMNEVIAIKNMGGEVWRINREGVEAVNAHVSETSLDKWLFNRVINNNGTLNDLRVQILGG